MSEDRRCARLNEAFQYVSDEFLDIVEEEKVRRKKRPPWAVFAGAAACIFTLIVLPVGVMAYNWLGIRELLMSNRERQTSFISLSGYHGSPEAQALEEWEEYWAHNHTDNENDIFIEEGRKDWSCYGVYSHEMGEKLDEIAARYGLLLHTEINVVSAKELAQRVGGRFLREGSKEAWGYGYIYENGTFQWDAGVELGNGGMADFQLRRTVKGTMDEVILNIGQADNYVEWQYGAACGEPVLLALSDTKALIFADYEDCFIAVNVLQGSIDGMTREALQELADKIDFVVLKNVRTP